MTVNPPKEGSSTWTLPHPFGSLPPPTETMYKKTGQKGRGRDEGPLSGGGRGKEPFLISTDESIRAPLAPNVCKQPPPDILKSDLSLVDYQLLKKEDVTDKPVEENIYRL